MMVRVRAVQGGDHHVRIKHAGVQADSLGALAGSQPIEVVALVKPVEYPKRRFHVWGRPVDDDPIVTFRLDHHLVPRS